MNIPEYPDHTQGQAGGKVLVPLDPARLTGRRSEGVAECYPLACSHTKELGLTCHDSLGI